VTDKARQPTIKELTMAMVTLLYAKDLLIYAKKQSLEIDKMEMPEVLKPLLQLTLYMPVTELIRKDPILSLDKDLTYETLNKLIEESHDG
jgi:hypothetical protein